MYETDSSNSLVGIGAKQVVTICLTHKVARVIWFLNTQKVTNLGFQAVFYSYISCF